MIHLITELSKYVMIILFAGTAETDVQDADDLHVSHSSGCFYGIVCGDEGTESIDFLWRAGAVCAVFVPNLPDCL